ncbi:MAG: STAS domain-containing protein, partial [Planctomycetota bacterium]
AVVVVTPADPPSEPAEVEPAVTAVVIEADPDVVVIAPVDPEPQWEDEVEISAAPSVYIKHLYGPLFFGFSSGFRSLAASLPQDASTLIVRMERVPFMDQSGLYTLEDTILRLKKAGKTVLLTGLQEQPTAMLEGIRLVPELIPEEHTFKTLAECHEWLKHQ